MLDTCRGVEVSTLELYRNYSKIMIALEEMINESTLYIDTMMSLASTSGSSIIELLMASRKSTDLSEQQLRYLRSELEQSGALHSSPNSSGGKGTTSPSRRSMFRKRTSSMKKLKRKSTSTGDDLISAIGGPKMLVRSSSSINFEKQKQRMQSHDRKLQALDNFCVKIITENMEDDQKPLSLKDEQMLDIEFGNAFLPREDESPLQISQRTSFMFAPQYANQHTLSGSDSGQFRMKVPATVDSLEEDEMEGEIDEIEEEDIEQLPALEITESERQQSLERLAKASLVDNILRTQAEIAKQEQLNPANRNSSLMKVSPRRNIQTLNRDNLQLSSNPLSNVVGQPIRSTIPDLRAPVIESPSALMKPVPPSISKPTVRSQLDNFSPLKLDSTPDNSPDISESSDGGGLATHTSNGSNITAIMKSGNQYSSPTHHHSHHQQQHDILSHFDSITVNSATASIGSAFEDDSGLGSFDDNDIRKPPSIDGLTLDKRMKSSSSTSSLSSFSSSAVSMSTPSTPRKPIASASANNNDNSAASNVLINNETDRVALPAFDLAAIHERLKDRATVIPLVVTVTETISVKFTISAAGEHRIESYQFVGQIGVKRPTNETLSLHPSIAKDLQFIDFVLELTNIDRMADYVCNNKFCRKHDEQQQMQQDPSTSNQDSGNYLFECRVPQMHLNHSSTEEIVLLKYRLRPQWRPMPLKLVCRSISKGDTLQILVEYKINPQLFSHLHQTQEVQQRDQYEQKPLEVGCNMSMLVSPLSDQLLNSGNRVVSTVSKPEGRWNTNKQKLLWTTAAEIKDPQQQDIQNKLLAKFKLQEPLQLKLPDGAAIVPTGTNLLLKFNVQNSTFGKIHIAGASDRKRNSKGQVFLGGIEPRIASNFAYQLE